MGQGGSGNQQLKQWLTFTLSVEDAAAPFESVTFTVTE
jgi:hypothetical protein